MQSRSEPGAGPGAPLPVTARTKHPASIAPLSIGAVAARLGVATATVRSWGRRYGLLPSGRSTGGHRRFTETDVADLVRMQMLVADGSTPAAAAAAVSADRSRADDSPDADAPILPGTTAPTARRRADTRTPGGPGGRVLAVPGASRRAQGLARAAGRLDAEAVTRILCELLEAGGAVSTWDEVLRPVLVAAGDRWLRTGEGIDIEHVLSECTMDAFRTHRARQPRPVAGRPILLACSAGDLHVLPLHVLAAALAERRVPILLLGAQMPSPALVSAIRRTRAAGVFLWRQQTADGPMEVDVAEVLRMRPAPLLVVGGPGWEIDSLAPGVRLSRDLAETVTTLTAAATAGGANGL